MKQNDISLTHTEENWCFDHTPNFEKPSYFNFVSMGIVDFFFELDSVLSSIKKQIYFDDISTKNILP